LAAPLETAATPWKADRASTICVRLIAREQPVARTTFGENWDFYLAELQHKEGEHELVRLSYRFLHYQPEIPELAFDYSYRHSFRAVLDGECSGSIAAATRRYVFGPEKKIEIQKAALRYASAAPRIDEDSNAILPCYVIRPSGYIGSKERKHRTVPLVSGGS
jgi:hypothetical protein